VAERARLHLIAHHKLVAQSIRHQAVARAHERPSCFCVGPELLLRPTSALSQLRPLLLASWAVCAVDFSTGPGIDSVSAALRTAAMFALAGFGSRGGSAALYALGRRLVSRQIKDPRGARFPGGTKAISALIEGAGSPPCVHHRLAPEARPPVDPGREQDHQAALCPA
jgi:hypothetical protein